MNKFTLAALAAAITLVVTGCATTEERAARLKERAAVLASDPANATPPEEVKPIPYSPLAYSHMTCREISAIFDELTNEEARLATLQTRREYRSRVQRKFLKIGRGDGEDTMRLAAVRGKRDAAIVALEKKCALTPETPAAPAPSPAPDEKKAEEKPPA
ncbi:MAG: hypothetical protein LBF51_01105 [Zoogloeaceae bacterium]|jgi:hypothetical protein|nr:hypothetical protein [Zoogloeaceae bacterium]